MKLGTLLAEHLKQHEVYSLNSFAVKTKKEPKFFANAPCYAQFRGQTRIQEFAISIRPYKWHRKDWSKAKEKAYLKYCNEIMQSSHYAHCFLTKDTKNHTRYSISMNVDVTPGEVIGAAVALRMGYEYSGCVDNYWFLRKNGVSVNTALLLCNSFSPDGIPRGKSGHSLFGDLDWDKAISFIKKGLKPIGETVKKGNTNFSIFKTNRSQRGAEYYNNEPHTLFNNCYSETLKKTNFGNIKVYDLDKIVELAKELDNA